MTIQFEGITLTLTPEQESQVRKNRASKWRSKDAFEDILVNFGFVYCNDASSYEHPDHGWIAILEESETEYGIWSVWMWGNVLRNDPYPGGHKYRSWKVLEKEIINALAKMPVSPDPKEDARSWLITSPSSKQSKQ